MHSSNLALLFILPLLVLIWGVVSLLKGTFNGQSNAFKAAFLTMIVGVLLIFFTSAILTNNKVENLHPELRQLFLMATGGLAFSALIGLLYTNFKQFVPPFFIRMTLFFGVTAIILGGITSFDTEDSIMATSTDSGSQFQQIDSKKL